MGTEITRVGAAPTAYRMRVKCRFVGGRDCFRKKSWRRGRTCIAIMHVGLLERGQRMPSILVAQQLATALGTTMAELLGEVEGEKG